MNRLQKGGAGVLALAVTTIGGAEGISLKAYPDPATRGYPFTICYGHTGHVTPGERLSLTQCKALLIQDLMGTANQIEHCIHVPMPDARYVAVLSLAYNIGAGGFCRSSIAADLNAGRTEEACARFPSYNRAAGFVMAGLTSRRKKEEALCLEDL